ncbi:MAG: DUF5011 domain-containing protein, partial [bacterium]|nr:DUF5011 domain-containing protein [bacterium]
DCAADATGGGGGDLEFTYGTNIFSQVSAATSSALQITSTGTSTFAGGLEVWRQIAAPYFHATSTTATSTFAGGLIVDGSTFAVDYSTNKVGIGTTSPSANLHIVTGTGATLRLTGRADGSSSSIELLETDDANGIALKYDGSANAFSGGRLNISNYSNSSAIATFDRGGNVGIGTTSPWAKLSVAGNDTSSPLIALDALTGYDGDLIDAKIASTSVFRVSAESGSDTSLRVRAGSTAGYSYMVFQQGAEDQFELGVTGTGDDAGGDLFYISPTPFNGSTGAALAIKNTGFIGIGTTSPRAIQQIENEDALTVYYDTGGVMSAARPAWTVGAAGSTFNIGSIASYSGTIANDITSRLTIYATGWVDIGDGTSAAGLGIYTNDSYALEVISSEASGAGGGAGAYLYSDDGAANVLDDRLGFVSFGGAYDASNTVESGARILAAAEGTWDASSFPTYLAFQTVPSGSTTLQTRMTITSAGNIGIGTTSPYAKLSVVGEVVARNFTATSTTATSTLAGGFDVGSGALQYDFSSGVTSVTNLNLGALSFDTDAGILSWIDMPVTSSASAGTVESYTAQIDGNPLLTVYAQSDGVGGIQNGRVGIGTTSPSATLTVWSATTTAPVFNVTNTASSTLFAITNAGNVGIGTTSPYAKLSVVGEAVAQYFTATSTTATSTFKGFIDVLGTGANATSTFSSNLWVKGTLQTGSGSIFLSDGGIFSTDGTISIQNSPTASSTFSAGVETTRLNASATSTLAGLRINSGGLQVSTMTSADCDVKATTSGDFYCGTDATGGGGGSELEFTYGTNIFSQVSAATSSALKITSTGTSTFAGGLEVWRQIAAPYFHATSTTATSTFAGGLIVDGSTFAVDYSSGFVGIGTLAPEEILQIIGTGDADIEIQSTDSTEYTAVRVVNDSFAEFGIELGGSGSDDPNVAFLISSANADLRIGTNDTAQLTVSGGGNVGIGTTTPNWGLQIASSTPYLALTDSNATTDRKHVLLSNIDGVFRIGTSTDSLSATSTALSLDPRGPAVFGIGTSSPWRTLSVSGTVSFDGLTSSGTGNAVCITSGDDITDAGGGTCTPSSIRFKENVVTLETGEALDTLSKLHVVSFDYKKEYTSPRENSAAVGLIAEEVELVDPRLVDYDYNGVPLTLHFERITGLTVQAIQELNLNLETLASTTATTTSESQSFTESFFSNMFSRVTQWLANAANGIGKLFAQEVHTDTLCISDDNGETCVTKEQLDGLLAGTAASQNGSSGSNQSGGTGSESGGQGISDVTPPTIVIQGNNPAEIAVGSSYADLGAVITDDQDENTTTYIYLNGVITTSVSIDTSVAGTHTITYTATDDAGNTATADRTVIVGDEATPEPEVTDTTAPIISLIGAGSVTVTEGDTYIDEGATANDDVDGDISASIVTANLVDTNTPGSYQVTYNVTDVAGNQALEAVREVIVEALPEPEPPVTATSTSTN